MNECAYYVDNWFYGYQSLCSQTFPQIWLNPLGYVTLFIFAVVVVYYVNSKITRRK